jgi:hypothetical protein
MSNEEYVKQSTINVITILANKLEEPLPFMGLQRQSLENLEELRDGLIKEYNQTFNQ